MNVNFKFQQIAYNGKMPDFKAKEEEKGKEEHEEGNVPVKAPEPDEIILKGSEALANMNRAMIGREQGLENPRGINTALRWEHPEGEDINMVRETYLGEKKIIYTQRITVENISDIEKLIVYAEYLLEKDPEHATEYQGDISNFNEMLNRLRGRGGDGEGMPDRGNVGQTLSTDDASAVKYTPAPELYNIYEKNKNLLMEMNRPTGGLVVCIPASYTIGENGNSVPATWIPLAQHYYNEATKALATLQENYPDYLPDYTTEFQLLKNKLNELLG